MSERRPPVHTRVCGACYVPATHRSHERPQLDVRAPKRVSNGMGWRPIVGADFSAARVLYLKPTAARAVALTPRRRVVEPGPFTCNLFHQTWHRAGAAEARLDCRCEGPRLRVTPYETTFTIPRRDLHHVTFLPGGVCLRFRASTNKFPKSAPSCPAASKRG